MQKYKNGDRVKIIKDLPLEMSHFPSDKEAIIEYSYKDVYGGYDDKNYSILIKNIGERAWYPEDTLILIEKALILLPYY